MLNRELLRYRLNQGAVVPGLVKDTPALRSLAEDLLGHWQKSIGERLEDIEESAIPLLHRSRTMLIARGFHKLVGDACTFADPTSAETLRSQALAASAERFVAKALAKTAEEHRAAVAAQLGSDAAALLEGLYADLPGATRLASAPAWTPDELFSHYNLALCQGLLLSARELEVTLHAAAKASSREKASTSEHAPTRDGQKSSVSPLKSDTGGRRRILSACRFHRLLCEVRATTDGLHLTIGGPDAVLDQASRYGLNLAQFLPRLAAEPAWTMKARLRLRSRTGVTLHGVLELNDRTGLPGSPQALGYVPPELRDLSDQLAERCPDWRFVEPELRALHSGELVVPDLAISVSDQAGKQQVVSVELFHRWHGRALARRLDQIAAGRLPGLAIGVERGLAKLAEIAPLLELPTFSAAGFLFSDIPTQRALSDAIRRVAEKTAD
ncbi:hypothetical protein LBMAG53_35900 [Planctomycetota bacterium]|nr:hypothetical protein LBMAG53_35900 [Planctomycetota bacterium]